MTGSALWSESPVAKVAEIGFGPIAEPHRARQYPDGLI